MTFDYSRERGVVYNTKRIGSKTDPCGTLQNTVTGTDVCE